MSTPSSDEFQLSRFVEAQSCVYEAALEELKSGEKRNHWMWFIFPQVAGLGSSSMAQRYAIRSRDEARAYLEHPILGVRIRECVDALLAVEGRSAEQIMGHPDFLKLNSSMTLFAELPTTDLRFDQLLEKYYSGDKDQKTLTILSRQETEQM